MNKKYNELSPLEQKKSNARSTYNTYKRRGSVHKPEKCLFCGSTENVEAHHVNYDKPLEVTFLCRYHHKKIHSLFKSWEPKLPK